MRLHIMWGCGIALHSLCMAGHGSVWLWISIVAIGSFEYCIFTKVFASIWILKVWTNVNGDYMDRSLVLIGAVYDYRQMAF